MPMFTGEDYLVATIKHQVSLLYDTDNDLDLLKDIHKNVELLIKESESNCYGYFIAIYDVGLQSDFIRYYEPIGYLTKTDARVKLHNLELKPFRTKLREVSKETYNDFIKLRHLTKFFEEMNVVVTLVNINIELDKDILAEIACLREKLDLSNTWQRVV